MAFIAKALILASRSIPEYMEHHPTRSYCKTRRFYTGLCLLLLSCSAFSQALLPSQIFAIDSLANKLHKDSLHIFRFQKFRPYANIDTRNSFIRNKPINVFGAQLGTQINDKHVLGLGFYKTSTQVHDFTITTKDDKKIDTQRELALSYFTAFYQYVLIDKRYFEVDIPVEIGYGQYQLQLYNQQTGDRFSNKKAGMLLCGAGPMITLKPLRWIGVSGMAGYRLTYERNPNINLNGLYFSYGLWLDIRQIIRDTRYYMIKKPKYKKQIKELLLQ